MHLKGLLKLVGVTSVDNSFTFSTESLPTHKVSRSVDCGTIEKDGLAPQKVTNGSVYKGSPGY